MIRYEKIKFTDGDNERTVFLRVTRETPRFLSGVEVDGEGEDIEPKGYGQRIRLIEKITITWRKPYKTDLKYGTLVPVKEK